DPIAPVTTTAIVASGVVGASTIGIVSVRPSGDTLNAPIVIPVGSLNVTSVTPNRFAPVITIIGGGAESESTAGEISVMVGPAANLNASSVPPTRGVLVPAVPPVDEPLAKLTAGAAAAPVRTVCVVGSGAGLKKLNVVKPFRTAADTVGCP